MSTPLQLHPLPSDLPSWKLPDVERLRDWLANRTYVGAQGELRWLSNDAVIGPDTFRDAFAVPPAAQVAASSAYVEDALARYREREAHRQPSAEELAEIRNAFGPGREVVDIITGRRIRL